MREGVRGGGSEREEGEYYLELMARGGTEVRDKYRKDGMGICLQLYNRPPICCYKDGGDVYLLLKLLLPTAGKKRVYNLQSKQLVKLLSQVCERREGGEGKRGWGVGGRGKRGWGVGRGNGERGGGRERGGGGGRGGRKGKSSRHL